MKNIRIRIATAALLAGLTLFHPGQAGSADDDHAGHDHAPPNPPVLTPPPADSQPLHDDAAGPHDHAHGHASEVHVVHLSPEALKAADLTLEPAGPGVLHQGWDATGEIHFNTDAMAKVGPRVAGRVLEIHAVTGAKVAAGDLLAVLQSASLGNAKIEFFTARANLELAQKEQARAQNLLANTRSLLKLLDENLPAATLAEKVQAIKIGEIKSRLLTARSAWRLAQATATRAAQLKQDNLVSAADFELRTQEAETAHALYTGAREEAELQCEIAAQQAERALRLDDLAAQNAERRLHIFGYSDEQVAQLTGEKDERVARYEIRAPVAGTVIARNLAIGEQIDESQTAFVLADLSTVWCNLQVASHLLHQVQAGQRVTITAPGAAAPIDATIAGILPSIDEQSRTGTARAVLNNTAGLLKPGLFVSVKIETARLEVPIAVRVSALQTVENQPIVFVASPDGDEFTATPVTLGRRDGANVEILAGLQAGASVVIKNSFILKAELGKAGAAHEH